MLYNNTPTMSNKGLKLTVVTLLLTGLSTRVTTTTVATSPYDCPLPGGVESATHSECAKYTACHWTETGQCLLTQEVGYRPVSRDHDVTGGGSTTLLRRKTNVTMYGHDVEMLRMDDTWISHDTIRLTFRDANRARYEVPLPLNLDKRATSTAQQYQVKVAENENDDYLVQLEHLSLYVGISPYLIYSDQFIELHIHFNTGDVYGFGENNHDSFRHDVTAGTTWPMFARDRPPGDGRENLYGVHPFFLAIVDQQGSSFGMFIKNSNAMEYRFQEIAGKTVLTLRTIGGIIDIFTMFGDRPMDVIRHYHSLIGYPIMPAYWGLGFQLSRFGYNGTQDIRRIYERNKKAGVPQDIQYADIDYMDQRRDFTVDPVLFANLSQLVQDMRSEHRHFVLIYDPAIAIDFGKYPPVDRGKAADVFVKWMNHSLVPDNQCKECADYMVGRVWPRNLTLFPDFFNINTVRWWRSEMAIFYNNIGRPDGFWIDMNEPSNFATNQPDSGGTVNLQCPTNKYDDPPYPTMLARDPDSASKRLSEKTLCMTAAHTNTAFLNSPTTGSATSNRLLHYDVHNLYGWSEFQATRVALNTVLQGRRGILVGRSTYPGSGRWGGHWLGDNTSRWKDLKRSIIGMLEMSMFGIPYVGADICGFNGNTTEHLCLRWMQLGAFYPFCRNHNTDDGVSQDPATWPSVSHAARQALGLRYRLLPVLYTLLYQAQEYGTLVVRPLAFQFPQEPKLRTVDTQFMWGDSVMIAPVLDNTSQVNVTFPPGGWYDLRNDKLARRSATSSSTQMYHVALHEMIPVFAREGSVLVMQQNASTTHRSRRNPFEVHVFAGRGLARGELFWDDGDSIDSYKASKHYYCFFTYSHDTLFTSIANSNTSAMKRPYINVVKFYGVSHPPARVIVDRTPLVNNTIVQYNYVTHTLTLSPLKLMMAHQHIVRLIY